MANAQLERQTSLPIFPPTSATIIGCGGVGSWLAMFLAMAGVPELWLWDGDTVAAYNLNRTPYALSDVGKPKSDSLSALLKAMRPDLTCYAMPHWTPDLATSTKCPTMQVAACTDTHASRVAIHKWASSAPPNYQQVLGNLPLYPYIELSSEGEYGGITWKPAEFTTDDEAKPGYASVPVWAGPCVAAAMLACYHILHSTSGGGDVHRIGWDTTTKNGFDYFYHHAPTKPPKPRKKALTGDVTAATGVAARARRR